MIESTETLSHERRHAPRAWVPGIAVLRSGTQLPSVWRVSNLSAGGVGLVGDGRLETGRHSLSLHVAGHEPLELQVNVLRRQLVTRGGRCGVRFVDITPEQQRALHEMAAAQHAPAAPARRALVVTPDSARARTLASELAPLGFAVHRETSPGQAAAWLQLEETEVVLVDESVVESDRWSLLQFVRDTAPEIRRLVIASDVRGFRLYFAVKAGLVEGLVEPAAAADDLARHLAGAPAKVTARRGRSAR
jgi:ActR/RegA family two-component response regulator